MAEYPRLNQSPFFRSFPGARAGNVIRNRQQSSQQSSSREAAEARTLQHYPLIKGLVSDPRVAPPHQQAQQQQPPQPVELDPGQAAEHILRINEGLPDGVRFEPMEKEVWDALKKIDNDKKVAPVPVPATTHTPTPAATPVPAPVSAPAPKPNNKKLPDGVHYEPLDDETMAILKKIGKDASTSSESVPTAPTPTSTLTPTPTPTPQADIQLPVADDTPDVVSIIEGLIQDERNSAIFYQYLSDTAPTDKFKGALKEIVGDCNDHCYRYQQMLQKVYGREYEPKNTQINTTVGFDKGVDIAVLEEKKILESITTLMDHVSQTEEESGMIVGLQNLLNKRLIRIHYFQWVTTNRWRTTS